MILERVQTIAHDIGVPYVIWHVPLHGDEANELSDDDIAELYKDNPLLTQVFVAGASGYLNKGVNNNRDISNGTPFTYHSLQLDPTCPNYDNDRTKINSSKPGECIVLSTPPLSINVELHCGNPNDYAAASLVEKRIVIPILANVVKKITVAIRRLGSVQLKLYVHQCDFGCAFTYYKAQGKTMKLALACLNKPPENPQITYEALFVFLSRVKRQECCKILPLHNSHNYDHLKNLRPPMNLVAYLKAFDEGGNWCRERCKAALIIRQMEWWRVQWNF